MRALVVLITAFLFLMFGASSQASEVKKAKTVDELIKMYDVSSCKMCHSKQYEEWEKSLHATSIFGHREVGRTVSTFLTTFKNGLMEWQYSGVKKPEDIKVKHLTICTKCHLPQLADAEDSVAQEIVKLLYDFSKTADLDSPEAKKLQQLNINCLICHNRNAIIHKWTDGKPDPTAVYGSKEGPHMDGKYTKIKKGPVINESILCGQCHGLGPNLELENPSQCATLYGTYLWAYKAEGGQKNCQDCHMQKSGLGHNMQSYRSKELAKMAIEFHASAYGYIWRDGTLMSPMALLTVEMKNHAGHAIPDG